MHLEFTCDLHLISLGTDYTWECLYTCLVYQLQSPGGLLSDHSRLSSGLTRISSFTRILSLFSWMTCKSSECGAKQRSWYLGSDSMLQKAHSFKVCLNPMNTLMIAESSSVFIIYGSKTALSKRNCPGSNDARHDNIRIPPIPDRLAEKQTMPETRSTCASPNQVTAITGVNEPWGEEHLQAFSEWFRPIYSSSPNSEQSPSQLSLLEFYWGWGAAISF